MKLLRLLLGLFLLCISNVNAIVILQYHNVAINTPKSTTISPEMFKLHMDYLSDNQFKVISLEAFKQHLDKKIPFPDKSVMITFDDGYRNIAENAAPLLKQKKFPYVLFIATQPILEKNPRFMNWQELQKLVDNGASVANHSRTHSYFIRRLTDESESEWRERIKLEIVQAQDAIDSNLSQPVKAFAYPYGEHDQDIREIVKSLGFLGFAQNSGAFSVNGNLQSIPRFPFGGNYVKLDDFVLKIHTLPMPILGIEILDENNYSLKDQVLSLDIRRPKLKVKLHKDFEKLDVQCYLSGKGKILRTEIRHGYLFQPEQNLPEGRSKYNCTAMSSQKGRYFWFSQLWIRKLEGGLWYSEEE